MLKGIFSHWRRGLVFAAVWALVIPLCAGIGLVQSGWHADEALAAPLLAYAIAAFFGGWISVMLAERYAGHKKPVTKFSFMFATLTIFTLGLAALVFFLQFRLYFSQWHEPFPSMGWAIQTFFTSVSALYLFLATGLRPLLPWGVVLLFFASWLFSRGWQLRAR